MTNIDIALALWLAGVLGFSASVLWWQRHHPMRHPVPGFVKLACIGGLLALLGAMCFAFAAMLTGD